MRKIISLLFFTCSLVLTFNSLVAQTNWEKATNLSLGDYLLDYEYFNGNLVMANFVIYESPKFNNRTRFYFTYHDGRELHVDDTREKLTHWKGKISEIFIKRDTLYFIQQKNDGNTQEMEQDWFAVYATPDLKTYTLIDSFKFWRVDHFAVYKDSVLFLGKSHRDSTLDMFRMDQDFSGFSALNLPFRDRFDNGNFDAIKNSFVNNETLYIHGFIFIDLKITSHILSYKNGKATFEVDHFYKFDRATKFKGNWYRTNSTYPFNNNESIKKFMMLTPEGWVGIGRHDLDRCYGGATHRDNLYFSAIVTLDQNKRRIMKFNGVNLEFFSTDTFNDGISHVMVFKDEIYAQGSFYRINGESRSNLVKRPLLNLVNLTPVANPDIGTLPEDSLINIPVTANDKDDNGDFILAEIIKPPKHGQATRNAMEEITYTPNLNWNGIDTLYYSACDRGKACDTSIVIITVFPVNDQPKTVSLKDTTDENSSISRNILASTLNFDEDSLFIQNFTTRTGAVVLESDSILKFTPAVNFSGIDTVFFTVCDPSFSCDSNQWLITVIDTSIFTGIKDSKANLFACTLFPNPAENTVSLNISDKNIVVDAIQIFSMDGKLLQVHDLSNSKSFSIKPLSPGIYLAQLINHQNPLNIPPKILSVK